MNAKSNSQGAGEAYGSGPAGHRSWGSGWQAPPPLQGNWLDVETDPMTIA